MKKINIGIIGCGHWGPNFVRNFSQIPNVGEIFACDTDYNKLAHIKSFYRSIETSADYKGLLKERDIDAFIISTPANTHYRIAKEALLRNKHVLVEKPLCLDVEEGKELIRFSKKSKKVLMVGHTFVYNPAVNKMKEIIDKGELGKIYYIHARRTNLGPLRKDVNAIFDLSPHDISIINYLLGDLPREVSIYAQRFLSHRLEDVGFIIMKYPKNILAHLHASWLDPKKVREMTIVGSRKMLVYEDTNINEPIRIYDKGVMSKKYRKDYATFEEFQLIIKDGEVKLPRVVMIEPLKIECQHFIDCIINNTPPLSDGHAGLEIVEILKAISESLASGSQPVRIE